MQYNGEEYLVSSLIQRPEQGIAQGCGCALADLVLLLVAGLASCAVGGPGSVVFGGRAETGPTPGGSRCSGPYSRAACTYRELPFHRWS